MTKFQSEIQDMMKRIARLANEVTVYQLADELLAGVDLSVCAYVSAYKSEYSDGLLTIRLTLSEQHKDCKLAVQISRKLGGLEWTKSKNEWDSTLQYSANTPEFSIVIEGAVPATCHVTETEVPLTEEEIETAKTAALASVKTVRVVREIVCSDSK